VQREGLAHAFRVIQPNGLGAVCRVVIRGRRDQNQCSGAEIKPDPDPSVN